MFIFIVLPVCRCSELRTTSEEELARLYHIPIKQTDLPISYNIAPSQKGSFDERGTTSAVGHKLSIELAEFDLAAIGVVLRSLETVLEGFEKW